jgi:hypothetical protein
LATAAWLVLPQFRGAAIIYEHYVRPYFYKSAANVVDKKQQLTDSQRKFLSSMSPQARASVADFIDNNGLDAFDKIIAAVNNPTHKNEKTSFLNFCFFILEFGRGLTFTYIQKSMYLKTPVCARAADLIAYVNCCRPMLSPQSAEQKVRE